MITQLDLSLAGYFILFFFYHRKDHGTFTQQKYVLISVDPDQSVWLRTNYVLVNIPSFSSLEIDKNHFNWIYLRLKSTTSGKVVLNPLKTCRVLFVSLQIILETPSREIFFFFCCGWQCRLVLRQWKRNGWWADQPPPPPPGFY